MRHIYLLLITAICFDQSSTAQSGFQRTYGTASVRGYAVLPVSDGYLLAGSTFDNLTDQNAVIIKTDPTGNTIWVKEYGGTGIELIGSVCLTSDGGFAAAGVTWSYTGPSLNDWSNVFLFKFDSTGNVLWSRSIDRGQIDVARSVRETSDNGFILCGSTGNSSGNKDLLLIKTDSSGNTQWTQVFGTATSTFEEGYAAMELRGGGYAAVGYASPLSAPGDTSAYLIVTNAAGTGMFARHHVLTSQNLSQTYGYDIIQDSFGRLVIAGKTGGLFSNLFYAYSPFLLQTDSTGSYIDSRYYALNTGQGDFSSIREDVNGGYITAGTMGNFYPLMTRVNYNLSTSWSFCYDDFSMPGPIVTGFGHSVAQNTDGSFVMLGERIVSANVKMHLIKVDSTGNSNCTQAVPPFAGNAGTLTHSSIQGTVFSIQGGGQFDPLAVAIPSSISDSVLCSPTSLDETMEGKTISVFPNPAGTLINVHRKDNKNSDGKIRLLNILGSTVTDQIRFNDSYQLTLDVSSLAPGIYFIEYLENSQIKERIKLIVAD